MAETATTWTGPVIEDWSQDQNEDPSRVSSQNPVSARLRPLRLAVVWIDWYAYHLARFEGLLAHPELAGRVAGVELVGGIGVHAGLKFREELPPHLPVETLLPQTGWHEAGKLHLSRLVWRHLTRLDPAAVLVPGYYTLPAIAAALWAKAHSRTSILMTESTAFDHRRVGWREAAKSLLIRTLFDAAVSGGSAHRRYLAQLGFPMDRVAERYDVVDNAALAAAAVEERAASCPETLDLPSQPFFLYVGRLAPEKNIETLLAAWLQFRREGGQWALVLVGDGPTLPALEATARASGFASEIVFAGLRSSRELPRFYARAGCFVLPSTREPWGLVVNEAMACGLPVLVSSQCGCAEDLVHEGQNGFTFVPASITILTERLRQIAELTPEARRAMGEASIQIISAYTPQQFGQEIARVLNESGAGAPSAATPDIQERP